MLLSLAKTLVITVTFSSLFAWLTGPLKKDESVVFFPTSATMQEQDNWQFPVHHWVFEKEEKDLSRRLTQKVFSEVFEALGVTKEQAKAPLTQQRVMWFLVDNKRWKPVTIQLDNHQYDLALTQANGHAETQLQLAGKVGKTGQWLQFKALDKYQRNFSGEVQLIPPLGLSVISDIDDTIKISQVLDKKALIRNTFVNPYRVTAGFPDYYQQLQKSGAFFHYVSASPWQLYPALKPFLENNYPKGSISLRNFRLKDSSFFDFLKSSRDYKINRISEIISRYPKHQFLLIGDSGEHDPEVYAKIYKRFSGQIKRILIRAVKDSDLSKQRFDATFANVPQEIWQITTNPMEGGT